MCLTTSLRAEFHTTWQGEPAARSPLHPHRQPSPASSQRLPDACRSRQGKAQGMARDGATYGRCITSQTERSSSPDTPMTKRRLRSPLDPIDQPSADWMPPLHGDQGCRALNHDEGAFALPSIPSSRGVPAPCNPASSEWPANSQSAVNKFCSAQWGNLSPSDCAGGALDLRIQREIRRAQDGGSGVACPSLLTITMARDVCANPCIQVLFSLCTAAREELTGK